MPFFRVNNSRCINDIRTPDRKGLNHQSILRLQIMRMEQFRINAVVDNLNLLFRNTVVQQVIFNITARTDDSFYGMHHQF